MGKTQSTFVSFLDLLKVKHTKSFSNKYFNEHPHKYNLFGLSNMLSNYGVENAAIQIPEKESNIIEIQTPFIAQFGGDFVAVHKVETDKVFFLWRGIKHILSVENFIKAWTGIILLVEPSEKSIEPEFISHRKADTFILLKNIAIFSSFGLIFIFTYIYQSHYNNLGISLLISANLVGLYISWLLLLKQKNIQSQYADKICSLFKQKDCNNILDSKSAKLFGIISWSEIGFGYFLTSLLLLLFFPSLIKSISLLNMLTLPFTVWSAWYQRVKFNQWCVLCLIVLILLWSIFIINFLFGYLDFDIEIFLHEVIYAQIALTASCYCFFVLVINVFAPKLNSEKIIQSIKQSLNSLKSDEDVFVSLLKKQPYYDTNDFNSVIEFGDPNSKLHITILSNPYCNPCSNIHQRIEELLKQTKNSISFQYILSSFNENLNSTNKYLIAACLDDNISSIQVFKDWFEKGKELRDDFFKILYLNMDNPEIEIEFEKHESWKKKTQIQATPTVLVNGYKLPEIYKIEDLRYFTDLDL